MKCKFFFLTLIFFFFGLTAALAVSFNVPAEDEVYNFLEEIEAIGAIDSQIWGIKPFTETEVARLLAEAQAKKNLLTPYLKARLNRLWARYKDALEGETPYLKPLEDPYLSFGYTDKEPPENIRGRELKKNNFALGFESKWYVSSHLLFHSQFELADLEGRGHTTKGRFLMGYGKIGFGKWGLEVGVDNVWWGQGYTGNLLFSLNPPPFNELIKLELEQPVLLPWIFQYLGPFKFSLFFARLESERVVPHPWLIGMKMSLKPFPFLEIGLTRSVMCGGEGRDLVLSTILFAQGENVYSPSRSEGDQKAGIELRFRPVHHLIVYWEGAGEDEAGYFPSRWAHIAGIYMPDLWGRLGVRFEYATIAHWWYHHHVYKTGYTYYGRLIGYYTDRNVDTYFGEISYDINQDLRLSVAYWHEENNSLNEIANRYQLALLQHFSYNQWPLILSAKYRYSHFNQTGDDHYFFLELQVDF